MAEWKDAQLVRVYINEQDKYGSQPLYEAIVLEAQKRGLAGATVLRGVLGYGNSRRLHTTKILELSENLPLVIEIVDHAPKIDDFIPTLEIMAEKGLITLEKVRVCT